MAAATSGAAAEKGGAATKPAELTKKQYVDFVRWIWYDVAHPRYVVLLREQEIL